MYCDSKHRACSIQTFYSVCATTAGLFLLSVSFLGLFGLAVPLQDMLVQQSIIWKENNPVAGGSA